MTVRILTAGTCQLTALHTAGPQSSGEGDQSGSAGCLPSLSPCQFIPSPTCPGVRTRGTFEVMQWSLHILQTRRQEHLPASHTAQDCLRCMIHTELNPKSESTGSIHPSHSYSLIPVTFQDLFIWPHRRRCLFLGPRGMMLGEVGKKKEEIISEICRDHRSSIAHLTQTVPAL